MPGSYSDMSPDAQTNTWLKEIGTRLRADVDGIFLGKFFVALKDGNFRIEGLGRFASEYYVACNGFPMLLSLACTRMPTDELRMPLVRNLWDEHGQGDIMKSHRVMLAKLLSHLGVSYQENPHGPADRYLQAMSNLCKSANVATILGMFGPGCESFTPREYRMIVAGLRDKFAIPDDALEFFLDHIKHDREHNDWFNEACRIVLKDRVDVDDTIKGARTSIAIECQFWNDMYDYCC
jgi:pyrroloquinoline quinone (PQQ) biosynthesis protein C